MPAIVNLSRVAGGGWTQNACGTKFDPQPSAPVILGRIMQDGRGGSQDFSVLCRRHAGRMKLGGRIDKVGVMIRPSQAVISDE
jgi:hypothetical protein